MPKGVAIVGYDAAVPLRSLKEHPNNRRRGDLKIIRESIRRNGLYRPLVVQRSTRWICAGNQTAKAARAEGYTRVPVVWVDVDAKTAQRILLVDNRANDAADYDRPALLKDLEAIAKQSARELAGTGYDATAMAGLRETLDAARAATAATKKTTDRSAPEADEHDEVILESSLPKAAVTQRGDRIQLGRHVLYCGDSTVDGDVDALLEGKRPDCVFTDPPYAIYGSSTGIQSDITDDKMVRPFFLAIIRQAARVLKSFGHLYVCCDWRSYPSWWEVAKGTGVVPKNMLVWDKRGAGLGSNYANTHELMLFASVVPMRQQMTQKITGIKPVHDSNVWQFNRVAGADGETREHNAQKPLGLVRRAINNSTDEGGTVLDLFGGAGTTLIACEGTGRVGYVMEIEPRWCDVIVARYERVTGAKAERPARKG